MSNQTKIPVEATIDSTWGTGVLLTNPKALDKSEWKNHRWITDIL